MYSSNARIGYACSVSSIISSIVVVMVNGRSWSLSQSSLVSSCNSDSTSNSNNPMCNVIALYLTKKSKDHLKDRLSKVGYKNYTADYVVIKRLAGETISEDVQYYEQFYGDKAAFRLKGIIKTDNDLVVVVLLLLLLLLLISIIMSITSS